MQALETAVRMDPLFVIARLDLARYYDHHGNPETAEQVSVKLVLSSSKIVYCLYCFNR